VARGKSRPKPETTYTADEVAAMLGVTLGSFRNRHRKLVPDGLVVTKGRATRFKPAAIAAIVDALVEQAKAKQPSDGGGESDQDVRYRRIKADMADLDLQKRRGELVEVSIVRRVFSITADQLRRASETLERQYDGDAAKILDHALDDASDAIDSAFPDEEAAG